MAAERTDFKNSGRRSLYPACACRSVEPLYRRLVFDLKVAVNPQVFSLNPVGKYKHRLVLDLYPKDPIDPIAALILKGEWKTEPEPAKTAVITPPKKSAVIDPPASTSKTSFSPPVASKPEKMQLKRMVTIVIDPGHGGEDSGAIGARGSKEKDVVLSIGKRLKAKIEQQPNMRVVMTRNADFFVPLERAYKKREPYRQTCSFPFTPMHSFSLRHEVPLSLSCLKRAHLPQRHAGSPNAKMQLT